MYRRVTCLVSFVVSVLILTNNTQAIGPAADVFIRGASYGDTNYGDDVQLLIKNSYGGSYDRKVYIRFEITSSVSQASLDFTVSSNNDGDGGTTPQTFIVEVYGLAETLDHTWTENNITWNNAPANSKFDHSFTADAKFLGSFIVDQTPVGGAVSFSDPALVDFINDDTDNQITLMLRRTAGPTGYNIGFASKEDTSGYSAPELNMVVATEAFRPDPADGEMLESTWVELSWRPGESARSHDVYFSDSLEAVNSGMPEAFQGNQTETTFIAGLDGFAYPQGLVPGTTYYWRIDEVNDADPNSPWKGPVWSFWIPPRQAYNPRPAEGQMFVPTDVTLEWTPGLDAERHRVYIGDNFDDVNNATGGTLVKTTTFTPGTLQFDKKYYWRVDEFDPPFTYRGAVWSFTTAIEGLGTAVMDRWENIPGSEIQALKSDPNYPEKPDVTETVTSFAWNGPNLSNYGARIEAWLYVPLTGDYTFWLNSDDQGELWLSTNDDPSNAVLIAQESSHTLLDEWGTGEEQSAPIPLVAGCKYYIAALWKEGTGNDHCQVAWQGPGAPQRIIIPGHYLSPFKPMAAYGARPANEATGVTQRPVLRWKPGLAATGHEVYFGTDEGAVREATAASASYQGRRSLGDESFTPGQLPWATTFFWRIDEVNDAHPDSPWTGEVWTFTTADYLIVDDFEDYTDDDITGGAIWQHWLDGFGVSANGSQVGYVRPPFVEKAVVHGGRQSMPLFYNNSADVTNSEAELTLDWPRDWTEGGVTTLSLWFKGRAASLGRFVEEPPGTFTVTGLGIFGIDILGIGDEFHFAYKKLTGPGTIIARLDSLQDNAEWATAGVMIRESLESGSRHALAALTSDQEVISESRLETDGAAINYTQQEIAAPRWLKLQRDAAGNFAAFHSADGSTWVPVKGAVSQNIPMRATVYVGLAVAGYSADLTCQAVFSQVQITGEVAGAWEHQDVGIAANVAEPLYVAVSNAGGPAVVVTHENPNAAVAPAWTQWRIDLSRFAEQGIDLRDIEHIAIGLGARGDATADGGSGVMFFDDITLLRPTTEPQP